MKKIIWNIKNRIPIEKAQPPFRPGLISLFSLALIGTLTIPRQKFVNLVFYGEENKSELLKRNPNSKFPKECLLQFTQCYDGDTCTAHDSFGYSLKLRLIGIDAPEMGGGRKESQKFASEAKEFLNKLVKGSFQRVFILDGDKYGRFLVLINFKTDEHIRQSEKQSLQSCFNLPGKILDAISLRDIFKGSVNAKILQEGFAFAYTKSDDFKIRDLSVKMQGEAQKIKKGLWSLEQPPENPSLFRNKRP